MEERKKEYNKGVRNLQQELGESHHMQWFGKIAVVFSTKTVIIGFSFFKK